MFIRTSYSTSSSNVVGTFRHITFVAEFPSTLSIERLDELNDEKHVMVFSVVGGDHSCRIPNYRGTISLVEECNEKSGGQKRTIVTEKYTVNVPEDSNEEETRYLVDTLVGFNSQVFS
uniref:Bet v I/Major latex protein domain-containing protein n=1 Tax=Chenopodium quinoa TaxID=63459 RepID=A0A803MDZ6_CHEQI